MTENGCFAKTYGLRGETEPLIYRGAIRVQAWIENIYPEPDGPYNQSVEVLLPLEIDRF